MAFVPSLVPPPKSKRAKLCGGYGQDVAPLENWPLSRFLGRHLYARHGAMDEQFCYHEYIRIRPRTFRYVRPLGKPHWAIVLDKLTNPRKDALG